jgi:DNA-binding MarR family transcriptional regulator
MTKTYALLQLLRHGPMCRSDIITCTGWPEKTVDGLTYRLIERGQVRRCVSDKDRTVFFYQATC